MKISFGINTDRDSRKSRVARRNLSGQALTEAVIMLSLLSFMWLVAAYTLTLAENRVRCAAIGRHAAWLQAHGTTPAPATELSPYFIRDSAVVTPSDDSSSPTRVPVVSVDENSYQNAYILAGLKILGVGTIPIQHVEQQLIIGSAKDRWIYHIEDQQFPFMRGVFDRVGMVGVATSEWATMDEFLDDQAAVIAAILAPALTP